MPSPIVGPSYNLESRSASVQRTINLVPVPLEPGNERTDWVLKDIPGLRVFSSPIPPSTDEWRPWGTTGQVWRIDSEPPAGGPTRVWDVVTGETFFPSSTPFGLWLQRRSVQRVNPPSDKTIVTDVENLDAVLPALGWTTSNATPAPTLELMNAGLGLWRLRRVTGGPGMGFSDRGTLTIGGPGAGLRTLVTFADSGIYPAISYEYLWAT